MGIKQVIVFWELMKYITDKGTVPHSAQQS